MAIGVACKQEMLLKYVRRIRTYNFTASGKNPLSYYGEYLMLVVIFVQ